MLQCTQVRDELRFNFERARKSPLAYLEVGVQSEVVSADFWLYSSLRFISDLPLLIPTSLEFSERRAHTTILIRRDC